MRRKVRIEHARRLAIARQRLSGSRPKRVTADDIHALVRALGCLQLDPTAVVARSHLLVLFSRLGAYDPKLVDTLLWDQRRLYEYWAHQASIVPTDDARTVQRARPRSARGRRFGPCRGLRATHREVRIRLGRPEPDHRYTR